MELSQNILKLKPSATAKVNMMQQDMARQGIDVVNFSVGEPDFDTPEFVKQAAIKAMEQGFTKYTANTGVLELRQAIADKLKRDNNLDYKHLKETQGSVINFAFGADVNGNPGHLYLCIEKEYYNPDHMLCHNSFLCIQTVFRQNSNCHCIKAAAVVVFICTIFAKSVQMQEKYHASRYKGRKT